MIVALPPLDWYGKGVFCMELFASFIGSVMAGIVSYYICKWLDGRKDR